MLIPCPNPGCEAQISHRAKFCSECGTKHTPQPDKPVSAPVSNKKKLTRMLVVSSLVGVPFWVLIYFVVIAGDGCSKAQGSLTAKGLAKGDLTFVPKVCKSGQHMNFSGVALFEKKNGEPIVTVVKGHLEPTYVLIDPPSCGASCRVKLTHADCTRFLVEVERTSTTVNDIRLLDGFVLLTCALPSGAKIDAELKYSSCD